MTEPIAIAIGVGVLLLGLLVLRFLVKTAFTLLKLAVVAAIAFGVYLVARMFV